MERVIDAHSHLQPRAMVHAHIRRRMADTGHLKEFNAFLRSPARFVAHLDAIGVERAWLINYVAPEVIGFTADVNDWVAAYSRDFRDRLVPFGSVHPLVTRDCKTEAERLLSKLELPGLKVHPPHQEFAPNAYLEQKRFRGLRQVYAAAERHGAVVMVHTGTSVFAGARSRLGDPMLVDDVAVDFPDLKIVLAHGGRPLWCDAAFFLARRHKNVWIDLSSIPPNAVLRYFPRLAELPGKFLFGSDWPAPGVPGIGENLAGFRGLHLSAAVRKAILGDNAAKLIRSGR